MSFLNDGMVLVPCTMKALSGSANSYAINHLVRVADVTLKEKRKLFLNLFLRWGRINSLGYKEIGKGKFVEEGLRNEH